MISRRMFTGSLAAAASSFALPALGQDAPWPNRPIRVVMPFPAGGAADVLTRILADQLATKIGQSFVIENRTGAGGNIGMTAAAKSPPDGYTLVSATIGTMSINQYLFANMPYDPVKDFVFISKTWENCNCLFVPDKNPAKTVAEFIDWAKQRPQGVTFGSAGIGTTPQLAGELFRVRTGVDARHVPFRGGTQTIAAMLSGDIDFSIDNIASYVPLLQSGQIRGLAVAYDERWPTVPNIPTMAEAGMKDFVLTSWGCWAAPAGTPADIVTKLSAAIRDVAADPAIQKRSLDAGARIVSTTPEAGAAFAASERQKWSEVVKAAGLKPG